MNDNRRIVPEFECWTCAIPCKHGRPGVVQCGSCMQAHGRFNKRRGGWHYHPIKPAPDSCTERGHDVRPVAQKASRA